MQKLKKGLTLLLALALVWSLAACGSSPSPQPAATQSSGAAETGKPDESAKPDAPSELTHVSVLGHIQTGSRTAVDDILTPIWREKTGVIPDIVDFPRSQDANQWLQMQIAGGTLPDVIAVVNNIIEVPERRMMLKNAGFLKPISLEMVVENMPLTAQYLNKLGVKIEDWYLANAEEDGLLYYIPTLPNPLISEENRNTNYGKLITGAYPYFLYYRDDILKMVYPEAKTEAELVNLIVQKNGELEPADVLDAPVYELDGLLDYLRKVKALKYHDEIGGFDIIPCHPSLTNVPERLYRSLMTATGIWWNEIVYTPAIAEEDKFINFTQSDSFKAYISFLNTAYDEGLLGEEFLIQKDDQREAKMVNGEYAVVNNYFPIAAARAKTLEDGRTYGWRVFPAMLIDLKTPYQDTRPIVYSLVTGDGGKSFNPNTVTDEEMPKLLHWVDWNYSEEAMELRSWGIPDMYTGDGADRRFKPEYKDLETYMVKGIQNASGQDGIYYGMRGLEVRQDITFWNHEVHGMNVSNGDFVNSPRYVYPLAAETADAVVYSQYAVRKYYRNELPEDQRHFFVLEQAFPSDVAALRAKWQVVTGEWNEVNRPYEDDRNLLLIGAISGSPKDFEANYQAYADMYKAPEIVAKEVELKEAYFAFYNARAAYRTRLD
ncbi:MAG: hypothetical protein LBD02_08850 [Christensenellaceae bacterium]|jgi:hypothetical protein|nr:hypothetical protein [Christensenellaceae bacterium]